MKILIINGADIKGGAAKVGYHLAQGLRDRARSISFRIQAKCYIELYQKVLAHQSSRSGAIG
jgi:hypothetical protein